MNENQSENNLNQYYTMHNPYSMPNINQRLESNANIYQQGSINQTSNMANENDMKFIPFSNSNNSMPNLQQLMEQSEIYPCLQKIDEKFNELLNSDITKMPFIPNPCYMMDMDLETNINNTNEMNTEVGRQHNKMYGHKNNPFHNYYNPKGYPYPYPYPYPYNNMYPPYYNNYPNKGINPLTWWLLTSMLRED